MIDLTIAEDRERLAELIQDDIEEYCAKTYNDGHRNHLGASVVGDDCSRKLWYIFRWVKLEVFEGRMQRLFQVGHAAEPRFAGYLRGIGFEVSLIDPTTNKQHRVTGRKGHFGGSLDGMCKAPARYEIKQDLIFLGEFKTNNTGSGYATVAEKELRIAKPKHFAQASLYGQKKQLQYGIYIIENKNDSDITVKVVELDWVLGQQLEQKAERIITAPYAPNRIHENSEYYQCKYCTFKGICHHGEKVEINCRSCFNAVPIDNGEWFCSKHIAVIPKDFIPVGCPDHKSINEQ